MAMLSRKQVEGVKLLLKHKVDVNQNAEEYGTPLHGAADNKDIVRILLEHKANVNETMYISRKRGVL